MEEIKKTLENLNITREDYFNLATKQIDYGLNVVTRTVYLDEEIELVSANLLKERIFFIGLVSGDFKSPVNLEISSFGGDVYGALAIIDMMRELPIEVNTVGRGAIMSGAAWILIAGTGARKLTENAIVMIHELSTQVNGSSKEIISEAGNVQVLQEKLYHLLETYTDREVSYWKEATKSTCYLEAEQAIELGLADEIVTSYIDEKNTANEGRDKSGSNS